MQVLSRDIVQTATSMTIKLVVDEDPTTPDDMMALSAQAIELLEAQENDFSLPLDVRMTIVPEGDGTYQVSWVIRLGESVPEAELADVGATVFVVTDGVEDLTADDILQIRALLGWQDL